MTIFLKLKMDGRKRDKHSEFVSVRCSSKRLERKQDKLSTSHCNHPLKEKDKYTHDLIP